MLGTNRLWEPKTAGMFDLTPLLLLLIANGAPIIADDLLGSRLNQPIDRGRKAADRGRWLGPSKTYRGALSAMLLTGLCAPLLGIDWAVGMLFGGMAILGDLIASFSKRRLGLVSSSQAQGLDQVPESLLPLAVCAGPLGLNWWGVAGNVALFWVVELLLSRLLYRLHIRKQPY